MVDFRAIFDYLLEMRAEMEAAFGPYVAQPVAVELDDAILF